MQKISEYLKGILLIIVIGQFIPPLFRYLKREYTSKLSLSTKVVCIPLKDTIAHSVPYTKCLQKYFRDSSIKAILLKIDSPGGAAGSSEAIAHEIEILKKKYPKPIIALTENICASAAYYIACTTDTIIASPSSVIGSIGALIPNQFRLKELLKHYHVGYETIKAGRYKNITDPFVDHPKEDVELLTDLARNCYDTFIDHVITQRPFLKNVETAKWAEGKLFTGKQALALGLIDVLGSWSDAQEIVRQRLQLAETNKIEWITPQAPVGWLSFFKGESSHGFEDNEPECSSSPGWLSSIINTFFNCLESRYGTTSRVQGGVHF